MEETLYLTTDGVRVSRCTENDYLEFQRITDIRSVLDGVLANPEC